MTAGGLVFVASKSTKKPAPQGSIKAQVVARSGQSDTDNDGLKDWEEIIVGTDPQNPDTDANGMLDGADRANAIVFKNEILDDNGSLPLPTAELTHNLSTYMSGRVTKNGTLTKDDFDGSVQNTITNATITATQNILDQQNPYTKNDIRIDESVDAKTYFNAIGYIWEKYFPQTQKNTGANKRATVIGLIRQAQNSDNAEEHDKALATISGLRSKYAGLASELKKEPVPSALGEFHLEFINFVANTALSIHNVSLLDEDPILGAIGIQHYIQQMHAGEQVLKMARNATKKNNIIFTDTDSQYARRYFNQQTI